MNNSPVRLTANRVKTAYRRQRMHCATLAHRNVIPEAHTETNDRLLDQWIFDYRE
jgi:hypothetical protein